ncbi:MAG: GyrI-like domain-containing protein [Blastocatellales bacterium]
MIEPDRFETGPSILLAGLRRWHSFQLAGKDIPGQWEEFNTLRPLQGETGKASYGAVCASRENEFEYMCAVEVTSFDGLPDNIGRMRVPEQRYAVFTHSGHVSSIRATWDAIWSQWLPNSGFKPASTPDFELYDDRYDPLTGNGIVEIWFPVQTAE